MATATPKTKTVTKTIETEEPDGLNLHLTDDEAAVLLAVVGKIAGDLDGPRQHTDKIYEALYGQVRAAEVKLSSRDHGIRMDKPTVPLGGLASSGYVYGDLRPFSRSF